MPLLSIPNTFSSGTVIQSAQVNANFTAIATLLNTTLLDDDNLQNAGITRASKLKAGTASYVLINGVDGKMSEEAQLSRLRGGTGIDTSTLTSNDVGKAIIVKGDYSGFELSLPGGAANVLHIFNRSN